jgi:hypothetical protein
MESAVDGRMEEMDTISSAPQYRQQLQMIQKIQLFGLKLTQL